MKGRFGLLLCAILVGAAIGAGASVASASEFAEFGFESANAEESTPIAGLHPDLVTEFVFNHVEDAVGRQDARARVKDYSLELPPGLVGNPMSLPRCSQGQFEAGVNCPIDSQIGVIKVLLNENTKEQTLTEPLYNLQPPHQKDEIARLGFAAAFFPTFVDLKVRTAGNYGVTATVHNATALAPVVSAKATIWGVPQDPSHDPQRLTAFEAFFCLETGTACFLEPPSSPEFRYRSAGLNPRPFLSNPTSCGPLGINFGATSYELPGQVFEAFAPLPPITGCESIPFKPHFQIEPTSHAAGAPTGLSAVLHLPQNQGLNTPATSAIRTAKVALPEGMTINSAAANGLKACSDEQVAIGQEVASNCPDGSKLGTATFVSPDLPEAIHGAVVQRTPASGNLFRIWLVTDEFGLHLKLPGVIKADKATGQLTTEFAATPQLPVEEIDLELRGGPRAPLKNPDWCGSYSASYEFTPWSGNPPISGQTEPIAIDEACGGGGFSPTLEAGVTNPVAGSYSPLVVSLKRKTGEDNVSSFDLTLPKGELAKLAGVPLCPDTDMESGNCPAASQIGSVAVATGTGDQPLWIPQPGKAPTEVFLAGPYKGAPYSVLTKVPAQAGPFDLGTVMVRSGLYVNPDSVQATVKTDALPQILEGVPVLYRTIHASIDRPEFAISPTNCSEQSVNATVASTHGAIASPADRFQVGDCGALKFGPSLKLRLKGGTKRSQYPALTATLRTHEGEANIGKASVTLPHSEFLAQEHINTVCTRVQFSVGTCPAGSIYGRARAITPLLDQPLEGPVYLRSSSHKLPDLVVALHGLFDVNLVGRIDSFKGGIRTTFPEVPDAPVTKFVLKMKGGKKSLLVNSTDICTRTHRATVKMTGQNGKIHDPHPPLSGGCGGK